MKNSVRFAFLALSAAACLMSGILNVQCAFGPAPTYYRDVRSAPLVISVHDTIKKNFYRKVKSADLFNAALFGALRFLAERNVSSEVILMASNAADVAAELWFVDEFACLTQICGDHNFSRDELAYAACGAMADSLNSSHSRFGPPTNMYDDGSFSQFLGIGAMLNKAEDQYFFLPVIEGEAAYNSGIRNMDRLVAVDDIPVGCTALKDVSSAVRGDYAGYRGRVTLTVARKRGSVTTTDSFTLTRGLMGSCTCASSTVLDVAGRNVNYIYLRGFEYDLGHCSARDVARCLGRATVDGVILDLRGNPGGCTVALQWVGGLFYDQPTVISRNVGQKQSFKSFTANDARGGDPAVTVPLVVIVNRNSASASEIFAEMVKQTRRGVVVGERTYGGIEEATGFELSAGASFRFRAHLGLAIHEIMFPNGEVLEGLGVVPDVLVPITKADVLAGRDSQLEAALAEIGKLMVK